MRLVVRVIPNAKENRVERERNGLRVYVKAKPVKGEANKAVTEVLARYFGVRKSQIRIVKGLLSREKVVEISEE